MREWLVKYMDGWTGLLGKGVCCVVLVAVVLVVYQRCISPTGVGIVYMVQRCTSVQEI